ncbi:MAG: hypothetical protein PVJ68_14915 [Candidatus Thiodiazotropha sp.]|jgi:hypothetical protein
MATNDSTGKARPVKKLKQQQLTDCQNCGLLARAEDITTLAQSGFSDQGALFQAIRSACDKHTNPYQLAGIGQYLADDWINTLDGELETLAALRRTQQ